MSGAAEKRVESGIMNKSQLIPPGYKQTEVGVIPGEWEAARLGDRTTKVGSGITPTGGSRVYKQEGRPFLRSQNVGWGNLLLDDIAFIDDDTHATFQDTEIEADDVFLNITGASIGRSALADTRVQRGNVNQHVCIIRTKQAELHPRFLNYFLLSTAGQKQIDSFQAGGNRQGLNFGQVRSFRLPLPPPPEQRAIAGVLSDVDTLIGALDSALVKKRDLKQAAMQQLLTGQKRLPGFDGEWEARRLGDVGVFSKGRGIKKDEVVADGLPCVRYGEIYTHHNDHLNAFNSFISAETAKQSQRIQKGDLLFAGSGETAEEIGKCIGFLGDEEAYAGGDIVIFRPIGQDSKFLGFLMNHPSVASQKARMGQGDAVVHISARNLARLELHLPALSEQTAIAEVLSDMDAELVALEQRREKTRALKQGMMQELLTGRVRLTKLRIDN
jgi:type I restriction enzyme S subunit